MPTLQALTAIAAVAFLQPGPAALRGIFEEGLERRRTEYGVFDQRTAQAARDLGMFLSRHGEEADARNVLDQVVRIDESLFGAADPRTLKDVAELAAVTPPEKAERLWKRASETPEPSIAARALSELGRLHALAGDRAGAIAFYRHALAKNEESAGKNTAAVALDLNALSKLVDAPEAVALLERALAIDRHVLGSLHAETATTEANLAGLLADSPRNAEAIRLASDALAIFRQTVGPDHPRTAVAASILGYAYEVKGDRRQAESMYRLALSIDSRVYGSQDTHALNDARVLSEFLQTAPPR
ncbi:MAG TPA: tetratricopeptide repeat protein [Bryobacteraceae bacterium]|jgi:tetratricopeptide (TPR) repeat protein